MRLISITSIIIAILLLPVCGKKRKSTCNNAISNVRYIPEKKGYALLWEENFDRNQLDSTKWSYRKSPRRSGILSKEALSVKDGFLNISSFMKNDTFYKGLAETTGNS